MSLYLAAYDISDARRRRQTSRFLMRFGNRVQRSVFEVWLEADELSEFRSELGTYLSSDDSFDLYPIEARHCRKRIRWQRPPDEWRPVLLL
jgi:CRISPR-associated endonuclease Cas2